MFHLSYFFVDPWVSLMCLLSLIREEWRKGEVVSAYWTRASLVPSKKIQDQEDRRLWVSVLGSPELYITHHNPLSRTSGPNEVRTYNS